MSRQFFALGGIYPRGWPDRPSQMLAECLAEGTDPSVEVTVRFDQAVERQVLGATDEPVDELVVTGHRYSTGTETMENEVRFSTLPDRKASLRTAGSERMDLVESGSPAGATVWRWEPLHATVEAWTEQIRSTLYRVRVAVANRLEWDRGAGERNLLRTLRSTQVVLYSPDAAFAPLGCQPPRLHEVAAPARPAA